MLAEIELSDKGTVTQLKCAATTSTTEPLRSQIIDSLTTLTRLEGARETDRLSPSVRFNIIKNAMNTLENGIAITPSMVRCSIFSLKQITKLDSFLRRTKKNLGGLKLNSTERD